MGEGVPGGVVILQYHLVSQNPFMVLGVFVPPHIKEENIHQPTLF